MAIRVEGLGQSIRYNSKLVPTAYVEAKVKQCHAKYPESDLEQSDFERSLSERFKFHWEFERCQSGSVILEWMRASAQSGKISFLRTLFETGNFDDFPFKVWATALLLSRGFTTKEAAAEVFLDQVAGLSERSKKLDRRWRAPDDVFESHRWVYSEADFQRCRSIIEDVVLKIMEKSRVGAAANTDDQPLCFRELWQRYQLTWSKLSDKQREAAEGLCMGERKLTIKRASEELLIGAESFKDRWHLVKNRFRKAFPEFHGLRPSKTHTKSKKGSYIYWGLYFHAAAETIREVTHTIYRDSGIQVVVSIPPLYSGPKREPTKEFRKWQKDHSFLEEAVTKLDEPVDAVAEATAQKRRAEEGRVTPDLWAVFHPDKKTHRDLSLPSPNDDDGQLT